MENIKEVKEVLVKKDPGEERAFVDVRGLESLNEKVKKASLYELRILKKRLQEAKALLDSGRDELTISIYGLEQRMEQLN